MLTVLSLSNLAFAVSPTGGIGIGGYFSGKNNPISGKFTFPGSESLPGTAVVVPRLGLSLTDHWSVEADIGWMEGSTEQYGYRYTMWSPRLDVMYDINPKNRLQVFAVVGGGAQSTKVNRPTTEDQSNQAGFGLYKNPSVDGVLELGPGALLWIAGPLHLRTDLRTMVTIGGDSTPDRGDIWNTWEWTAGIDLRAHAKDDKPVEVKAPVDTDGDGIVDADDSCPNEPEDRDGFKDTDGCPDPDNDEDGILDVDDKCPNDPEDVDGFKDADGCPDPDNDKDGIPDTKDKCPNDPETANGFEDTDGCPDELPKEIQKFTGVIQGIYFEFDKDVIQKKSEKTLTEAKAVLDMFPDLKIEVQGHTDSKGDDAYNLDLSQRRAESVVRWYVEHGEPAARFRAAGFGETRPIDTNDTETGRAKNRRVEFHPIVEGSQAPPIESTMGEP